MVDLARLRKLYNFGKDLRMKDIQGVIAASKRVSIKKKEVLIDVGSSSEELYFIRKGLIRSYHINSKGEEITFRLITEHELVANVDAILYKQPSRYCYEAMEDSTFFSLSYDAVQKIFSENPKLNARRKYLFLAVIKKAYERIESLVLLTPVERYEKFLEDYPDLSNRVPDKYIAHVLGITPVSLSRIRKRIASRPKKA